MHNIAIAIDVCATAISYTNLHGTKVEVHWKMFNFVWICYQTLWNAYPMSWLFPESIHKTPVQNHALHMTFEFRKIVMSVIWNWDGIVLPFKSRYICMCTFVKQCIRGGNQINGAWPILYQCINYLVKVNITTINKNSNFERERRKCEI